MNIRALLVPYDSGLHRTRMGLGPAGLIESLTPILSELGHGVAIEEIEMADSPIGEISTTFSLCSSVASRVAEALKSDAFPLVLSGNCNMAVGAIAGCGCATTGVVWFDAHGESTTPETTESGFLDGMGIAILTGACWKKVARRIPNFLPVAGERILLFGSRDVESAEIELLNRTNVQRSSGLAGLQRRIEVMAREVAGIYVHLDLDVLDPTEATANQWATPGGASIELLLKAAQLIRRQVKITGLGIGSYDPNFDRDRKSLYAAAAFARSIFG